jgi:hypothetical protein
MEPKMAPNPPPASPVSTPAAEVSAPAAATAPVPAAAGAPMFGNIPLPKIKFAAVWYQYVGEGSFAVNRFVRNPSYTWWVSLRPRVVLPYGFSLSMRQDMDMEWTNSESTTYNRQPMLGDTRLGIGYSGLSFPSIGLKFSLYGGGRIPVSLESRFRHNLGTVDGVMGADWSKWGIILSAAVMGNVNARQPGKPVFQDTWLSGWYGNTSNSQGYQDRSGRYMATQRCVARASELAAGGCPVTGASNGTIGALIMFLTAGYDFSALLDVPLTLTASLATISGFSSYVGPDDQYTPANGRIGISRNDATWGLLAVSWQALDWLSVEVGTSSLQPLLNRSNQYVRLPFWNVPYWDMKNVGSYSGAANYSQLSLGLTAAF